MMWDQLQHFHFLRPQLLLLVIPLLLLIMLVRTRRFKSGLWGRVCDEHLLPFLLIGKSGVNSRWSLASLGIIGFAVILAFAGPTWEKLPQPVFRSQAALIIVLDLSRSMDVTDVKPSRLERAKHKIRDILKQRKEGQTALVVYAAEAFVVTPLTEDTNTITSLVKNLGTDLMPYQGSYPEKALLKAIELFKQASALNGQVLLITDGIESADADDAIAQLTSAGHRLSVMGIGTEQGAPIADYRGGFVKSQDGSIVVARLDEAVLRDAAVKGGGVYQALTANDQDINRLLSVMEDPQFDQAMEDESRRMKLQSDQWREEGPWILLFLLPFIALAFRRGYLVLLVAILLPAAPQSSYAFDFASLWKNADQRAKSALEAGDNQQAAELFRDPQWKAAASYRAEDYQAAIEALESASSANDPDAHYNKGNALAKLGQMQEAIQSYEQALKIDPDHQDAKYNRDLVKEYLEKNADQQNPNNPQQNQQGEQNQQQGQDPQSEQQQNQQAQQDQSNQQDSQQGGDQNNQQQDQQQNQQQADQSQQQSDEQQAELNKKDQQQQAEQQSAQEKEEPEDSQSQDQAQMVKDDLSEEERKQARKTEQWLRRIPDDPGGLLRRKFRYQSELDSRQASQEAKPW